MRREAEQFPRCDSWQPEINLWAAVLSTFFQDAKDINFLSKTGADVSIERGILLGIASSIYIVDVCEMLGCDHSYFYKNLKKEIDS